MALMFACPAFTQQIPPSYFLTDFIQKATFSTVIHGTLGKLTPSPAPVVESGSFSVTQFIHPHSDYWYMANQTEQNGCSGNCKRGFSLSSQVGIGRHVVHMASGSPIMKPEQYREESKTCDLDDVIELLD